MVDVLCIILRNISLKPGAFSLLLCVFVLYVDIKQPFLLPENELQQPGSPSVKKSVEKGIVTVHEVKCKLYVKVIDISYCTH
jgi:hypothetical protein